MSFLPLCKRCSDVLGKRRLVLRLECDSFGRLSALVKHVVHNAFPVPEVTVLGTVGLPRVLVSVELVGMLNHVDHGFERADSACFRSCLAQSVGEAAMHAVDLTQWMSRSYPLYGGIDSGAGRHTGACTVVFGAH